MVEQIATVTTADSLEDLDSSIDEASELARELKRIEALLEVAKVRVKENMAKAGIVKRVTPMGSRATIYTNTNTSLDRAFLAKILAPEVLEKATKRTTSLCLRLI